jgi:uncharacterized OB-fold protein
MNEVKQAQNIGIEGEYDGDICPECGKVHVPNAVTLAAMRETLDMASGKIPGKSYHSLEEFFEDLRN